MPSEFITETELRATASVSPDKTWDRPAAGPLVIKSVNVRMSKETWFTWFACYLRSKIAFGRYYIPLFNLNVVNFHKGASWKGRQFWPVGWELWMKLQTTETDTEIKYLIEWEPELIIPPVKKRWGE